MNTDTTNNTLFDKIKTKLYQPLNNSCLAYFRIIFGLVMLWEIYRYFTYGWIRKYWISPDFHFTYFGFSWVSPLPGDGMYYLFALMGFAAIGITLGLFYRLCTITFFFSFTYMFLLEQTKYLNHFYFVCLISLLMIFIPAHHRYSLDARRNPKLKTNFAPAYNLYLLRFQMGVVYLFGGIAKLNPDWLAGQPLKMWMAKRSDYPIIGQYVDKDWFTNGMSYSGLVLDLFIVPALLYKRTRVLAYLAICFFHVSNSIIFSIGIFPWFSIGITALFFSADWPEKLIYKTRVFFNPYLSPLHNKKATKIIPPIPPIFTPNKIAITLIAAYAFMQIALPLRHFAYPGNPSWTEEGHLYAWHMKLRSKRGFANFYVNDLDNNITYKIKPKAYLKKWQVRKMATKPDLILQFAQHLEKVMLAKGVKNMTITVKAISRLNHHEKQYLIDPNTNLLDLERNLASADWIIPFNEAIITDEKTPTQIAKKTVQIKD